VEVNVELKNRTHYGVADTAKALAVTVDAIYKLLRCGRLDATKGEDGQWQIPSEAITKRLRERQARLRQTAGAL
jgi:predicted site-specific integrase-resolvase